MVGVQTEMGLGCRASRVAQWSRALHRSASSATSVWVRAQALSAVTGRSMGRRTIGLALSGLWRVWPVGISLSHRAPVTPVAGRAQCTLTKVARCTVFPPANWCGWLPGWMRAVLRSSAAWLGCVSEEHGFRPSSVPSPYGSCSDETR
jgi:hypothetical protein